jgi:hypothetical protein
MLLASLTCEAGGFFRRAPEVGEWARYEIIYDMIADPEKPTLSSSRYTGTMLLKCVGEETIDERRHVWIEQCYEMNLSEKFTHHSISKVLVPEEELLQGTLTPDDVRGWNSSMKGKPEELTFSADNLLEDGGGSTVRFLNAGAMPSTAEMSSRTIVANGEEIELTYFENSPLPTREYEADVMTGEITIWPHDELAFGVASMDFVSLQTHVMEESTSETLNETRFDLVETGTGAVSELPDYN